MKDRIKKLRRSLDMTQQEFADRHIFTKHDVRRILTIDEIGAILENKRYKDFSIPMDDIFSRLF